MLTLRICNVSALIIVLGFLGVSVGTVRSLLRVLIRIWIQAFLRYRDLDPEWTPFAVLDPDRDFRTPNSKSFELASCFRNLVFFLFVVTKKIYNFAIDAQSVRESY
jgi:hypothetical protein